MIETIQYSLLAYLVSGYVDVSHIKDENMMPDALIQKGMKTHAYLILIGTLVGMIPTVLDSLLVSFNIKMTLYIELNKNIV